MMIKYFSVVCCFRGRVRNKDPMQCTLCTLIHNYSVLHYVRKCIKVLNFIKIQVKVVDPAFYDMNSVPFHHGLATTHLTFLFSLADVGHSVLFSNDQNLCSKAIINGLKAFNHKVCLKSCLF